jgi:hypothetical protein
MFRLYFSVFWNQPSRLDDEKKPHRGISHDITNGIINAGSVFAGFYSIWIFCYFGWSPLGSFHLILRFAILPVSIAVAGILIAALLV